MSSHLPKIDDKALEFDVDIQDAQFNHEGRYFLRLSIHSLHTSDFTGIQVKHGMETTYRNENEAETDVVTQPESAVLSRFQDKQFSFRLPVGKSLAKIPVPEFICVWYIIIFILYNMILTVKKKKVRRKHRFIVHCILNLIDTLWTTVFVGFCKNDKNHDVYLLVEAFSLPSDGGMGRKVGEGKFAIYPRPNAPRIKADVEPGEDFYNYTDVLSLLRTVSTDSVQMHCGRIRSVYALREVVVPKPKSPLKTPPKKTIKKPTPIPQPSPPPSSRPAPRPKPPPSPTSSWGGDNISIMLPSSPAFPPLSDGKLVSANIVRLHWLNTLCLKYAHFKKASLSLSCKELMNYLQLIDEQFIKYHVVSINRWRRIPWWTRTDTRTQSSQPTDMFLGRGRSRWMWSSMEHPASPTLTRGPPHRLMSLCKICCQKLFRSRNNIK